MTRPHRNRDGGQSPGHAGGGFPGEVLAEPAGILSQVAYAAVFTIADNGLSNGALGARAATITSLLILGVPEARADALADGQP